MNRFLLTLSLATLSAAGHAPAQSFALLLRHGPGDLVLNGDLVTAIAAEPAVGEKLRTLLGDELLGLGGISIVLPGGQPPGTVQMHGFIDASTAHSTDAAMQQKIVDTVVGHLMQRLTFLLFDEPAGDLRQQSDELQQRIAELSVRQATLACEGQQVRSAAAAAQQAQADATAKARELQLRLRTTASELDQLEKLDQDLKRRRDETQAKRDDLVAQRDALLREIADLKQAIAGAGKQAAPPQLLERTEQAYRRAAVIDAAQADLDAKLQDVRNSLLTIQSRLPDAVLMQVRLRTEFEVSEQLTAHLAAEQQRLDQALQESFRKQADLQRTTIDLDVAKQILTETQGKLARLRPLRWELIRN